MLQQSSIDAGPLTNIGWIDDALCAWPRTTYYKDRYVPTVASRRGSLSSRSDASERSSTVGAPTYREAPIFSDSQCSTSDRNQPPEA